jgi:hypothetical protein
VRSLKNGKAVGPDLISNEMIKASVPHLTDVYVHVFNDILISGSYPKCWCHGYISNIFKDGSPSDPGNYRGITVNSCISKVFSSILNNRLEEYLKENNIMNSYQIGFKKRPRTADHMFVIKILFDKYVNKMKKPLYTCFIDVRKAYDSVWHFGLHGATLEEFV